MILTGKCREDFLNEYGGEQWEFNEQYEMVLVIEFLDSKGYVIEIRNCLGIWNYEIKNSIKRIINNETSIYRHEITKKAIICANNIYNK